ncbi:MAG: MFS transporter [Desulfobacterales bacterium]|nr:MFS transporter [Desulfobacterales bacterium]
MQSNNHPPLSLSWLVWGLGAAFYCFGFYQRVAPAVMTDLLMAEFHIGAAALGHLSAFYFYSYVAMQIPTGILADRWGPRKLLTAGAAVAGAGTVVFAAAPSLFWADLGRLLIGGSVAVAWVVMLKLASRWFHPRRYAAISGAALAVGVVGAVSAGVPLRLLVDQFDWRAVMFASGLVSLLLSVFIWRVVRDDPADKGFVSYAPAVLARENAGPGGMVKGLSRVMAMRNTWLLSLAPGGIAGPVLTFSGLWGVPFLFTHYHLPQEAGAAVTSAFLVSWAFGGPVIGIFSDRIGLRKPLYLTGAAIALTGWAMLVYGPILSLPLLVLLVAITGFSCGAMIIGFAFVKESVPPELTGTALGVCNMGVMMGPMILQPAIGWVLDRKWDGMMVDGVRIYSLEAYQAGFSLMIAWAAAAVILVAFTRETHCRQMGE